MKNAVLDPAALPSGDASATVLNDEADSDNSTAAPVVVSKRPDGHSDPSATVYVATLRLDFDQDVAKGAGSIFILQKDSRVRTGREFARTASCPRRSVFDVPSRPVCFSSSANASTSRTTRRPSLTGTQPPLPSPPFQTYAATHPCCVPRAGPR